MLAFLLRNSFITLTFSILLAWAGFRAWEMLPVDALPDLSDNQVIVWADWPGKSPEDVQEQIVAPLGRALQGLPGVRTVRGLALFGTGYVYVIFEDGRNLYDCRTRVLERLAQIGGGLPEGVTPRLGPDATALGQVYAFTLQGKADLEGKRYFIDQVVVPALQALPGVAEVAGVGGVVREYQVDVDPWRLAMQGLSLDDLMMAIRDSGNDVGAMSVEHSGVETMLRGAGFIRGLEDVENIVVRGDPETGAGLLLKHVADVHLGGQFRQGLLTDTHQEQAGAIVAMRVGADPVEVIRAVKHRLRQLGPALRQENLQVVPFYDRSSLIAETTATLMETLQEAMVTTVIVIAIFLLHVRGSLAVAVSLPLGMLFAFLIMQVVGVGANIMSLAGIAIAIGVMVDFGIIMTENVTQHLVALQQRCREEGRPMPLSPFHEEIIAAVVAGAREVARPLFTSAATTVIGFLPIFALDEQAGRLFHPLALTKTLAISGAVLYGTLLVPVLCRYLLPPWQVERRVLWSLTGLTSGLVVGWYWQHGLTIPMEHERWALHFPGWLCAPVLGIISGSAIWRMGTERLVQYEENPTSRVLHTTYEWAYHLFLRHKGWFAGSLVVLAAGGYLSGVGWPSLSQPLRHLIAAWGGDLRQTRLDAQLSAWFPGLETSFLPPLDEGSLLFMPSLPPAAGLGETQRVLLRQNQLMAGIPEVAWVMGKMGRAESALDPAPLGMIETVVWLKPYRDWPALDLRRPDGRWEKRPRTLDEVRAALAAATAMPGVTPSWLQPIETRVVMLSTGIRSLLALQIEGQDRKALLEFATAAEKIIRRVPGAEDVQVQKEGGKPYAVFHFDAEKLASFGLSREKALSALEMALGGMPLAYSVEGTLRYPVRLRYARELRDQPEEWRQVRVALDDGRSVSLSHLLAEGADGQGVDYEIGPMSLRSEQGQLVQYILLNARGRGEVEVVQDAGARLQAALDRGALRLPPGVTFRWVGRYEQKLRADANMRWILGVSAVVISLLIYIGTRSWLITLVILLANVPVATAGGFFFLHLWGVQMTTAVAVGFLVLLGVMFNDGILLGTYLQEQFRTPPRDLDDVRQRVFAAGLRRRRAAVMTNLTTLLSLTPVLWATGRGAEAMAPMILPVVGGMLFDLLSLFSVPIFHYWYWEWKLGREGSTASR